MQQAQKRKRKRHYLRQAPTIFIDYKQAERKEKKIKNVNKPVILTLIFFALSQSTNNALATFFVFFIIQPALST